MYTKVRFVNIKRRLSMNNLLARLYYPYFQQYFAIIFCVYGYFGYRFPAGFPDIRSSVGCTFVRISFPHKNFIWASWILPVTYKSYTSLIPLNLNECIDHY